MAINQTLKRELRDLNVGEVTEATPENYLTVLPELPDMDLILERLAAVRTDIKNLERARR